MGMIDSKLDKKSNERHKGNKILNVLIIFVMSIAIQIPVGISLVALPLSLRLNDWYTIAISMLTRDSITYCMGCAVILFTSYI